MYLNLGKMSHWVGECHEVEDYFGKAPFISSQIGHKLIEFRSLLCTTRLKVETVQYLLQCIRKYEQMRNSLKENEKFQISLLETHDTFPYKLLTSLLCNTGKLRDALQVEGLGRARVRAEFVANKFSVESHISADPLSQFGIEDVVKRERESNYAILYIPYGERQVLLWVFKANGDTCFRATDEVKYSTTMAEKEYNMEGIFKKSAAGFGVLPKANCEDRSLNDNVTTSLHEKSRGTFRGDETKDTEKIHYLCCK